MLGGLLLVSMACEAGPVPSPPASARASTAARPPDRGIVLGGEAVPRIVQWPPSGHADAVLRAQLDAEANLAVAQARLPVLVPSDPALLDGIRVMNGPTWTAVWSAGDGYTMALHASKMARLHPGIRPVAPRDAVRGLPGFVTRNEGIRVASWIEHGVAYDLSLECEGPDAPPCHDDVFLRELAASLRFVGPEEDER